MNQASAPSCLQDRATQLTNEALDGLILQQLTLHKQARFTELVEALKADRRQLDRRLQALRRTRKITYDTKLGWSRR